MDATKERDGHLLELVVKRIQKAGLQKRLAKELAEAERNIKVGISFMIHIQGRLGPFVNLGTNTATQNDRKTQTGAEKQCFGSGRF